MKVFLILILLLVSACATPKTEKEKEYRVKLTVMKFVGCIVVPTLPICVLPGK